jgi:hypothetical protein
MLLTKITLLDVGWAWTLIPTLHELVAPLLSVMVNVAVSHRAVIKICLVKAVEIVCFGLAH